MILGQAVHKGDASLRLQLLKWLMVPMLILMLLNMGVIYLLGQRSADHRYDQFLLDMSKALIAQLQNHSGQIEFDFQSPLSASLSDDADDQVFYLLRGPGGSYQFGQADLPHPKKIGDVPAFYQAEYHGHRVRMMAKSMQDNVTGGTVSVLVAKTLKLHDERVWEWIWSVIPFELFLIIFAGAMLWIGVGRGLKSLLKIRDEVARRSPQDLSPLDGANVATEFQPLIRGFNQMLVKLNESVAQQKRFIADAAHQLRTPIAGLKAQAELALQLNDPAEIRHSMEQMRQSTEQTSHLVKQLLVLARTEPEAQSQSSMHGLDVVALARNITTQWVDAALKKNIDLGLEVEENTKCLMFGNRFLLTEMLNNLIDNALRYTPNEGRVTIRVIKQKNDLLVEVEDNGPGIPEKLRERVFERFYRVLGTAQQGCGLGLAIVREIVTYHMGRIVILDVAEGHGTLFRLSFPIQKREASQKPA